MIYLDNSATSLIKPKCVIETVSQAMTTMGNPGRGATIQSLNSSRVIFQCRKKICQLINADQPNLVGFTLNATAALNFAILGLFKPGDHVITSVMEHNSVIRPLQVLQDRGVKVTYLQTNDLGVVSPNELELAVKPNTTGIVLTHASNLTGDMNDLVSIGELAHNYGLTFIVDAAQSLGEHPIDVKAMKIDILCFTGHKGLLGPQGTGGIYIREGIELEPLIVGGSGSDTYNPHHPRQMPTLVEAGTLNSHGIAGLNAALGYILDLGIDRISSQLQDLTFYFYNKIKNINNVIVYGHFDINIIRGPIVSINIGNLDSSTVSNILSEEYGINTRSGGHCAPKMHIQLGTQKQGAVRFSFSIFTSKTDLDKAVEAISEIANKYIQ